MHLNGVDLCDFCFEPCTPGAICPNCGLSHDTYHADAGLLPPGTNLLGKYIIGRTIGRGGFGATYLAYSSDRKGVVAIKEYFPTGIATRARGETEITIVSDDKRGVFEKGAKRLYDEAKTISRFNSNKNVVSVYEFFYSNSTVYYSMEYLHGIDLKGYVAQRGGKITQAEAITVMRGVCEALVTVHGTRTLHRDISPDNIFICTNGDVKLIDFGAAKQVIGDSQQVYSVVVKKGFAPVEQYKTNGKQGVWTDMYAVGATVYYILSGSVPVDAMTRIDNPDIEYDPELNLDDDFIRIIDKCLAPASEDRYQSAIELMADLDNLKAKGCPIGGEDFVQKVYNGVTAKLSGENIVFDTNAIPDLPNQTPEGTHTNQTPEGTHTNQTPVTPKGNQDVIKGVIIGACVLIIIVLLIIMIASLLSPRPLFNLGYSAMFSQLCNMAVKLLL